MSRVALWWRGWRVSLRIARRDALRARGRSALVLVMIALPVMAVTAADVVMHTADVGGSESLDRRLGAADALVSSQSGAGTVVQTPDPDVQSFSTEGSAGSPVLRAEQVATALGGARLVEWRERDVRVVSDDGVATADGQELDLDEPAASGLFDLVSGRLPRSAGEVVVNHALTEEGYDVGDQLELAGDGAPAPVIVGIAESSTVRDYPVVVGPLGSLGLDVEGTATWLASGGPVTWKEVRRLNAGGATVLSRAVMLDPPPSSEIPEEVRSSGGTQEASISVLALIVVMALVELVLLAGPAFAVGARRQSRSLALLAATGGTPKQARRVVLASAVVLGSGAAAAGVALGTGAAFALLPFLQRFFVNWFGPFEVPWLQVAGVAGFGLVSALLAAIVPAHIASRQDVVAVLAGRRGDRAPSRRSPLVGLVLSAVGVAGAAVGATRAGSETLIAASALFTVFGMILLVPVLLAGLGRVSGRLPLSLRYAVRDAARHRTRTVPAVAAVAATVAGVVALGIGNASDEAGNEATYVPATARGVGVVSFYGEKSDWPAAQALVERKVPAADATPLDGVPPSGADGVSMSIQVRRPGSERPVLDDYGSALGSDVLVDDTALPPGLVGVSAAEAARGARALRDGGLVVFTEGRAPASPQPVDLEVSTYQQVGDGSDEDARTEHATATFVQVTSNAGPQAVVSTRAARTLGLPVAPVALLVDGTTITQDEEQAIAEGLAVISPDSSFVVERGYRAADNTRIVQLVLAGLGAVMMLGGTLTATFLALSDARPDLATLSAVGASPRTRRRVAASYAAVVGLLGAVLGALVGFVPGIAVSFPLTRVTGVVIEGSGYGSGSGGTGPYLDIPWLLVLSLVVLLPLVTAAVVGLSARSRLPLVARLD